MKTKNCILCCVFTVLLGVSTNLFAQEAEENSLYRAVVDGDAMTVARLLYNEEGHPSDIDVMAIIDENQQTYLHVVCSELMPGAWNPDCGRIILLLSRAGVDMNAQDNDGKTPLLSLASRISIVSIQSIVAMGADLHALDDNGNNLLHGVVRIGGKGDIIEFLLEQGFDIDAQNEAGETSVYLTSAERTWSNFYDLVDRGANVTLPTDEGETGLHRAAVNTGDYIGSYRAVFKSLEAGADVNAQDNDGRTALHRATSNQYHVNLAIIFLLIQRGALIYIPDKDGWTPFLRMVLLNNYEQKHEFMEFIKWWPTTVMETQLSGRGPLVPGSGDSPLEGVASPEISTPGVNLSEETWENFIRQWNAHQRF